MEIRLRSAVVWLALLAGLWLLGVAAFVWYWPMPWVAAAWTMLILFLGIVMGVGDWRAGRRAGRALVGQSSGRRRDGAAPTLGARAAGQTRSRAPQQSLVAIAGVGDIGSRVAVAVVQSSVTRLAIADIDVVEYDNIGQSAFRSVDVGESKVDAIGAICREIWPDFA